MTTNQVKARANRILAHCEPSDVRITRLAAEDTDWRFSHNGGLGNQRYEQVQTRLCQEALTWAETTEGDDYENIAFSIGDILSGEFPELSD